MSCTHNHHFSRSMNSLKKPRPAPDPLNRLQPGLKYRIDHHHIERTRQLRLVRIHLQRPHSLPTSVTTPAVEASHRNPFDGPSGSPAGTPGPPSHARKNRGERV